MGVLAMQDHFNERIRDLSDLKLDLFLYYDCSTSSSLWLLGYHPFSSQLKAQGVDQGLFFSMGPEF